MTAPARSASSALNERTLRLVVAALAVFHLVEGLWMFLAPGSFFDTIGTYGLENTHYVGDLGAFVLAYAIALGLAIGRPSWRAPLLMLGAAWYAVHAVNHLFDIDEARSTERGLADTILLAVGAAAMGWLAVAADRAARLARR